MELECDGVGEEFDRFGVLWKFFFVDDISIVYVFVIVGDDDVMDCISGLFINLSGRFKIVQMEMEFLKLVFVEENVILIGIVRNLMDIDMMEEMEEFWFLSLFS